jgi:hypothetical protein
MTDRPELPYEKAAEEVAKATGKALDIVQSMSPAIADAYGWLIGNRITAGRERNLDALMRKTKKIFEQRDLKDRKPIPEQIGIPLLEEAQRETREEIQDLYAALLANAMDERFADDVRPEFIQIVKNLQPIDALVLSYARDKYNSKGQKVFAPNHVYDALKNYRTTGIDVSIENLMQLKCLNSHSQGLYLSPFGAELMMACDPHTEACAVAIA